MARSLRAPISWVVYDLANTIYSSIVVTLLIGPYVEGILSAR
jgi:MFS-type transporter involved in bile tolerance (Atg22 family)